MKKEITFTAKQVGERVKERRTELNLTMPELGKRIGVNKSTIQRYEADGVDPKRTMIINGLAEALLTTPEWLTGLSEDKEYDSRTLCEKDLEEHIKKYIDTVSTVVNGEPHQQLHTANRNAPCNTAENSLRYPLLSAFAVVPSGFCPPKVRKSINACKCSAVTVFSFLSPIGYFFILFTVPIYAITVPLLKLPGFSSSSTHISSSIPTVVFSGFATNFFAS